MFTSPHLVTGIKQFSTSTLNFLHANKSLSAFLLLLLFLLAFRQWKRQCGSNEPPLYPYWVPWLGSAAPFLNNRFSFVDSIKRILPDTPIARAHLFGVDHYHIFDADLASQLYRKPQDFPHVSIDVGFAEMLAHTEADLAILRGDFVPLGADTPRQELKKILVAETQNASLDAVTEKFLEFLSKSIDSAFPATEDDSEWHEVDLLDLVKRHYTYAKLVALMGSNWVEIEGIDALYDWTWDFDDNMKFSFASFTDLFRPRAAQQREIGLDMIVRWERAAKSAERLGHIDGTALWDPYWGLTRLSRGDSVLQEGAGITERGRARYALIITWANTSNSIPTSSWVVMQALNPAFPDLLPRLEAEIAASRSGDGGQLDVKALIQKPLLKSLYTETLRYATYSPHAFHVVHDSTLLGGASEQQRAYDIPGGAAILVESRFIQLDPRIWGPDAKEFRPDRFLQQERMGRRGEQEGSKWKEQRLAMRPFAGGENICPGRYVARNEMLGGLAVLLGMLEIEVSARQAGRGFPRVEVDKRKTNGLWPDAGFLVRVRRRKV